ncbi:MAG: response regulator [Lachnospiraceae bacterium]
MYQILIVDDDPLVLRRLTHILDWESLGFQIMGQATDGTKALAFLARQEPHIIISDINMPNMNGLELAEQIKMQYKNIQFVMLTVNDSFGCAQQALNLGVFYYILKPIEKNKLIELMLTLKKVLDHSQQQDQYIEHLKTKATISEKMIKDKFLNWLVSGQQSLSETQIKDKLAFYHIPLLAEQFEMICIHINHLEKQLMLPSNLEMLLETVSKCVENVLCEYHNCIVFSDSFYNINILLGSVPSAQSMAQNAKMICQSLRSALLCDLNLEVTILFSRKYKGYQNIYRCYYDTKYLSKYTPAILEKGIISFDDFLNTSSLHSIDFDSMRSLLLKYLRTYDLPALTNLVIEILSTNNINETHVDEFNILRVDMMMTGIMFVQENKTNLRDIFHQHLDPVNEIMEKDEPKQCIDFIINFYSTILAYLKSSQISTGKRLVEKCMELIEQNIVNPSLTVKWLASQLYLNETYLSKQFHKETGIPLVKYIGNLKLEIAKGYLLDGYSNLQSVAKLSGFSDPLYFSKCFKKKYGISPSKFYRLDEH